MKYIRIPLERIGVIIGHNGETKNILEKRSKININIDSQNGEIKFDENKIIDPLMALKLECIIRAIGRGFSPVSAMNLFNDDFEFFIFDIHDYVGKKENHVRRLKSRIIGKNGKTKRILEELTNSHISIYGHTISVISDMFNMDIIKKAIDMLLRGSMHATVYRFIESKIKKLKMEKYF
jgi:ribosomal RNA assembly protein